MTTINDKTIAISDDIQGTELPFELTVNHFDKATYLDAPLKIRYGGFGSDAAAHPHHPNQFYALTDRGPNADFDGDFGAGKRFLSPEFTPKIGLFELKPDGQIIKIKEILLKDKNGQPISGLPNPKALGGTNEVAYDASGCAMTMNPDLPFDDVSNPLKTDLNGLDPEGLAALDDGSFWVSDEYGPHVVHFDAEGVEIERINPFAADARNTVQVGSKTLLLPPEFAHRRANRGMEALTITPDQSTLVGVLESAMDHPDKMARQSSLARIVAINLMTGKIAQYLYRLNRAKNVTSGIEAISKHEFYVIEHDRKPPLQEPSAQKHIYKIDISQATDITDIAEFSNSGNHQQVSQDTSLGVLIDNQTLEQFTGEDDSRWQALDDLGLIPVAKTLAVDVIAALDYPHDKLEGLWLRQDGTLGLLNDDDFGITDITLPDGRIALEQKYLDQDKTITDSNRLYLVNPML